MNSRWAALVAASLVIFASFVITWQVRHYNGGKDGAYESLTQPLLYESVAQSLLRGEKLANIPFIVDRSRENTSASGTFWYYDLVLPKDARVFLTDMTGPTNHYKIGYYYWATYYLFPREIGTSLDHITRLTNNGFLGKTSESDQEILSNGFDVRMDITSDVVYTRALRNFTIRDQVNPVWFDSDFDLVIAFLLPLLTALASQVKVNGRPPA